MRGSFYSLSFKRRLPARNQTWEYLFLLQQQEHILSSSKSSGGTCKGMPPNNGERHCTPSIDEPL
jgi:hypothetical protein